MAESQQLDFEPTAVQPPRPFIVLLHLREVITIIIKDFHVPTNVIVMRGKSRVTFVVGSDPILTYIIVSSLITDLIL